MAEPPRNPQQPTIPQYRKEIRQETLKTVAKMFSEYYKINKKPFSSQELKEKTFAQVKEMDFIAGTKASSENEYKQIMHNLLQQFQQKLAQHQPQDEQMDPLMMATIMINSLPELKAFMDHTEFIGPHDLNLLQQLIQFIESIPVTQFGPQIGQQDQIQTVKLYYERLFFPIKQTIKKQVQPQVAPPQIPPQVAQQVAAQQVAAQQVAAQQVAAQQVAAQQVAAQQVAAQQVAAHAMQSMLTPPNSVAMQPTTPLQQQQQSVMQQSVMQQSVMQQSVMQQQQAAAMPPNLPLSLPPSMPVEQHYMPSPNPRSPQQKARSPRSSTSSPPPQTPPPPPQATTPPKKAMLPAAPPPSRQDGQPPNSEQLLKQLFVNVRTDCAVFYSTPHPPHF